MRRVAVITNVVPSYRVAFYKSLADVEDLDLTVFCYEGVSGSGLSNRIDETGLRYQIVKTICLGNEKFAVQFISLLKLLSFETVFIYGNPRFVSNVFYSLFLKIVGKRVVIWGQAHTAGARGLTERLRLFWWRGFKNIFVYNDHEAKQLKATGFSSHHVTGMNNGLDQNSIERAAIIASASQGYLEKKASYSGKFVLLSCARLIEKNQFELVIDALAKLGRSDIVWLVIGDGPLAASLNKQAQDASLNADIVWLGEIRDEYVLAEWFLIANLFVHPSAIGLSLFHAFGYGLPVLTHDNELLQMPEYSALQPGVNGVTYEYGSVDSLCIQLERCLSDQYPLKELGANALNTARRDFNSDVMARRFVEMAKYNE